MKSSNFLLKVYAITLTFILGYLLLSGFSDRDPSRFKEITVERINVIEPDGSLKMVISNSDKQHPGMMDGKSFPERERPAGMIFFNEDQDEVGGLVYGGDSTGSVMVISVDQYKNDQVMQLVYDRNSDGKQKYGLNLWDRSEKFPLTRLLHTQDSLQKAGIKQYSDIRAKIAAMNGGIPHAPQRMFTGKNYEDQVGVFIKDAYGVNRLQLYVDANNEPKIVFLDAQGKVIKEWSGK